MSGCAPVYETARLALKLAAPAFSQALADYYCRNRGFLSAFEPVREEAFYTEEGQRVQLEREVEEIGQRRSCPFYLFLRGGAGELIGRVSLNNIVWGAFESACLGYKLDKAHLCRGYMTEAVREVSRIAFAELGLHRIEANIMPRNRASLRVVEKAGFYNEGLALKYLKINGVWEDHIHMVLRSDMGQPVKAR